MKRRFNQSIHKYKCKKIKICMFLFISREIDIKYHNVIFQKVKNLSGSKMMCKVRTLFNGVYRLMSQLGNVYQNFK